MNYNFPLIRSIKDVEHALDKDFFMVADRGEYLIINYLYMSPDVFPEIDHFCNIPQIRREFRGIIFCKETGNILRRPLHKFFNYGERAETLNMVDITRPHKIYEKIDGTMIVPYFVGDRLIWGTKMGQTEFSHDVEAFVENNDVYAHFARKLKLQGLNPIFEWTDTKNRVVIDYGKESSLTLLAVRNIYTGLYHDIEDYKDCGIKLCTGIEDTFNGDEFLTKAKNEVGNEGYVIAFEDGHRLKVKNDWYCALHRVKNDLANESGVVKLIIDNSLDDIKPLLSADDLEDLEEYEQSFSDSINKAVTSIFDIKHNLYINKTTRKEFALSAVSIDATEKAIIFSLWDNPASRLDIKTLLLSHILKQCTRNTKFESYAETSSVFKNTINWND